MKLKGKDKYLLVICAVVCAFTLYMKTVYYPQQKTVKSMAQKMSGKQREIDRLMKGTPDSLMFEKDKKRIMQRIDGIRKEISRKMHAYPHVDYVGDLIALLTHEQVPEGAVIRSVKLSKRKENESMRQLLCEVSLTGDFSSLYEYIHNVEQLAPAVGVDVLDWHNATDGINKLVLDVSLSCLFARPSDAGQQGLAKASPLGTKPQNLFKRLANADDKKKKLQKLPVLKGIMSGANGVQVAVIDDQTVVKGQVWKNMELKEIFKDRVVVSIGGVETTVRLDKEAQ